MESDIALKYIVKNHSSQLGAYKCLHADYLNKRNFRRIKDSEHDLPDVYYDDEQEDEDEKQ